MEIHKKFFFNGLNELRGIAALCVVFHHIEQLKSIEKIPTFVGANFNFLVSKLGNASVDLFFTLSGFLITYLLLKEKNKYGSINIKKFYFRRILRIWPLYYLILFLSFILTPLLLNLSFFDSMEYLTKLVFNYNDFNFKTVILYLFFLPQFAKPILGASQSWSIGIEEQFYLFIPIVLALFRYKYFFYFLLSIISVYLLSTIVFFEIYGIESMFYKVFKYFKIQCMTIGALGGCLFYSKANKINDLTKSRLYYFLILIAIFSLIIFEVLDYKLQNLFLTILFLCLIFFAINDSNNFVFRNRLFSYFGKISYGIYMYHCFVILLILPLANKIFGQELNSLLYNVFMYTFCYGITIIFSIISYEFFELRFIKIKDRKYKI